jgi:transposase
VLQITPQTRILLAIKPVDFRKGIDGLAAICRSELKQDPFSGSMFVFSNRRQTSLKVLMYDGQGFWLCMKRLSKGRLVYWPGRKNPDERSLMDLAVYQLQTLFWNGDMRTAFQTEIFKPIEVK